MSKETKETFSFVIQDDKPHCITTLIKRGNGVMVFPRNLNELPPRVIEFMGFRMDNSEVIAIDDVKSIEWLRERLKEREDFTEISIKMNRKNVVTLTYKPKKIIPTPDSVPKLECMSKHGDGAHCGLGDWYEDIEQGIQQALLKSSDWTTGWYSSKKEIASSRISKLGKVLHIEVSVSDDFDTNGTASQDIKMTTDLEKIRKAIYKVWDMAEEDRKDNQMYVGYSIGPRKGKDLKSWQYTYIVNTHGLDSPSGDNYLKFGWQEKTKIPANVKDILTRGMENGLKKICVGNLMAKQWD